MGLSQLENRDGESSPNHSDDECTSDDPECDEYPAEPLLLESERQHFDDENDGDREIREESDKLRAIVNLCGCNSRGRVPTCVIPLEVFRRLMKGAMQPCTMYRNVAQSSEM